MAGCYEQGNKPLDSIQDGEFVDKFVYSSYLKDRYRRFLQLIYIQANDDRTRPM